jgi:diaminohydroxyphosphoribosylaminopyrimidine deaminase / 5-amino-6-(5-phosphoribosylamino)uracil reductase
VRSIPTAADLRWLSHAIDLSRKCPPSPIAFSVGAVIVDAAENEIASGYSRDINPHIHAEESALSRIEPGDSRLAAATLYSTLEPCSERRSRPQPCADLILAAGIPHVVIAWREPALFVADCQGVERLRASGVTVLEIPELGPAARAVNGHLPGIAS